MKKISVLGSTGSVGRQTLDVVRLYVGKFKVVALVCQKNWELLLEQIKEFKPSLVAVFNEASAEKLKQKLRSSHELGKIKVLTGKEGLIKVASYQPVQIVVMGISGAVALEPTLSAIKAGKKIALATKEVMVIAGDLVKKQARKYGAQIIPVDTEHSAIFQCIDGKPKKEIGKIYLTCSGGPFRGKKTNDLANVTLMQALNHPRWKMGSKITIDSATLLNKGLEVIEAMKLFDVSLEQIEVIVHPQSIVHSMVEFVDGNIMAQLGPCDMRFAIRHALFYPKRMPNHLAFLNWVDYPQLTFEKPDIETFRCLALALQAARKGGSLPVVLNAAGEVITWAFLKQKIKFLQIAQLIEKVMNKHKFVKKPTLTQISQADAWARVAAQKELENA
jgi:1-deoxy-D-xylulose-5-phosphate reductoisomerase